MLLLKKVKEKTSPAAKAAKKQADKATVAANKVKNSLEARASKRKVKEEVYVQYSHHEVRARDIIDKAKADYVSKGHQEKEIKEIQVYIKPSDNAAYYVINHADTGKLEF